MKILIVDDSDTSRMLLTAILKRSSHEDVVCATVARQAIEILEKSIRPDGSAGIDCILMDLNMPGMNGIEAAKKIKSHKDLQDIPIIMVTASDEKESLERAFEAGAMDFISKPVNKIELSVRVGSALKLKQEMDRRKSREQELEKLTRKLMELSNVDGLTGVANRRCFDDILGKEWRRSVREQTSLSALMIDIDFFKAYNDTYGHLKGDLCLKSVAQAIRGALKRSSDFLARYGGEEFVVLLPNTELEGAMRVAESIRANLAELDIEHASSTVGERVTVSIGLASTLPDNDQDSEELLEKSDQALYRAKESGRDRIESA